MSLRMRNELRRGAVEQPRPEKFPDRVDGNVPGNIPIIYPATGKMGGNGGKLWGKGGGGRIVGKWGEMGGKWGDLGGDVGKQVNLRHQGGGGWGKW